jgi:hypothetical protein
MTVSPRRERYAPCALRYATIIHKSEIRNPSIHISSYRKQSLLLQELLQKVLYFLPLALRLAPCALRLPSI